MDRKTILTLVAVTFAFIFFTSDTWHSIVRRTLGIPDPPKVEQVVSDSASGKTSAADTTSPRLVDPSAKADSALDSVSTDSAAKAVAVRSIVVRTPRYRALVSTRGGRLDELSLLSVTTKDGGHTEQLPQDRGGALSLKVDDLDLANEVFSIDSTIPDSIMLSENDSFDLRMVWSRGAKVVGRSFLFKGYSEGVRSTIRTQGWEKPALKLSWNAGLLQIDKAGPRIPFGPPHFNDLVWQDLEETNSHNSDKPVTASGPLRWVGLRSQYTMGAALFDTLREGELDADTLKAVDGAEERSYRWSFRWRPEAGADSFTLVATPLEVGALKAWQAGFEKVLFNGWAWFFRADLWFPELCLFVLWVLKLFHQLIPNYGVAIILLTIAARLAVFPLTLKQVKQSKRMAAVMPIIKPQIDALKEKHKGDPRKLQEETMRIYNENGVNPLATMAGCLPLFLQMPVFFALYMVLGRAIELRGAPFFGWISDLALPDVLVPAIKIPFIFPLGLTILPLFMAGSLLWLNKLTIKDENQKALVWMMPIMMLVFSGSFPSGLVLYWTVSNVFSVAQTWLVNAGPLPAPGSAPVGGTPKRKGPPKGRKA
jgi:YidC/Oxa1 family membrane protein insertase